MEAVAPMPLYCWNDTYSLASSPPPTSHSSLLLFDTDQNAQPFHSNGNVEAFPQKPLPTAPHLLRRISSVYSHKSTSALEPQESQSQRWMSKMDFYLQPEQLRHSTPNLTSRPDSGSPADILVRKYLISPTAEPVADDNISILNSQEEAASAKASEPTGDYRYWIQPNWTNFEPLFKSPRTPPNPPLPQEYLKESSSYAPSEEVFAESPSSSPVARAVAISPSCFFPSIRVGSRHGYASPQGRVDGIPLLALDTEAARGRTMHRRRSSHARILPKRRDSDRKSNTEVTTRQPACFEDPLPDDDNDPKLTERKDSVKTPIRSALKSTSKSGSGNAPGTSTKGAMRLVPTPILLKLTTSHRRACSTNSIKEQTHRDPGKLKERASIADMLRHVREENSYYSHGNAKGKRSTLADSSGRIKSPDGTTEHRLRSAPSDKKSVTFLETSRAVASMSSPEPTPLLPSRDGDKGATPRLRASTVSTGLKDRLASSTSPVLSSLKMSMGGLKRSVGMSKGEKRREELKKSIRMVEGSFR